MKPFQYVRDPLFVCACALYALNRWLLKPNVHSPFLHDHFNDLLLIPCALPVLLLMQRKFRLRNHDGFPTLAEIALNAGLWSVLFEVVGPHFIPWTVGDPWDVVAYLAGATLAGLWWHRAAFARSFRVHEL